LASKATLSDIQTNILASFAVAVIALPLSMALAIETAFLLSMGCKKG
jgi:MFS superfamily sulfate permease-like transporter